MSLRTTSTLASRSCSVRSSTCPSRNSSPRLSVRSSNGPSNPLMRTGNSEFLSSAIELPCTVLIVRTISPFASSCHGQWRGDFVLHLVHPFFHCLCSRSMTPGFSRWFNAYPPSWSYTRGITGVFTSHCPRPMSFMALLRHFTYTKTKNTYKKKTQVALH